MLLCGCFPLLPSSTDYIYDSLSYNIPPKQKHEYIKWMEWFTMSIEEWEAQVKNQGVCMPCPYVTDNRRSVENKVIITVAKTKLHISK